MDRLRLAQSKILVSCVGAIRSKLCQQCNFTPPAQVVEHSPHLVQSSAHGASGGGSNSLRFVEAKAAHVQSRGHGLVPQSCRFRGKEKTNIKQRDAKGLCREKVAWNGT